jgi:hypothetical protein
VLQNEEPRVAQKHGNNKVKRRRFNRLAVCIGLLGMYTLGVFLRWSIVGCLRDFYGDLPYTLESALLFHYADIFASGEPIPAVDKRAQVPEGLEVARKLSIGKDIVAAVAFKALGRPGPFREFVRRFDAAWFCIGILAVFLVVREIGGGEIGGLMAAAMYAITPPSVIRSTGLEFSRENFALPLIFLHGWLLLRSWRQNKLSLTAIAAGVLLSVAAATWDVTQLYILLLGVFAVLQLLFGKHGYALLRAFLPGMACLVVAGLTVPYLEDHGFLFSWGMLVWYSLATALLVHAVSGSRSVALPKVAMLVVLVALGALVIMLTAYPGTYSHFPRLLLAKLKYFNIKPVNPAKLSYEARILWTPALHSATSLFQKKYPISDFEVLLVLGIGPLVMLVRSLFKGQASQGEGALLFWLLVTFGLYLLFVRMEVFLVFFLCCLIGMGIRYGSRLFQQRKPAAVALTIWSLFVFAGLVAEARSYSTFDKIYRAADTGSPYAANKVLVRWLRKHTPQDAVVLANFTLEPTIFADAERAIVLHPKFESRGMRLKVRQYLEALFSNKEKDFHDFCVKNGVNYFVLHPGAFSGPEKEDWIYSPRYMVDRAERYPDYATLAMLYNPDRLQFFKKLTDIAMAGDPFRFFYRVFAVVSQEEIEDAQQHVRSARLLLDNYAADSDEKSLRRAEEELTRAVDLFPGCPEAHSMLSAVYTMKGETNRAKLEIDRYKQILEDQRN